MGAAVNTTAPNQASAAIDAEGCCETGPAPLDEAEAMRRDYEALITESERESAVLWYGIPVAVILGAAWAYVEFGVPAIVACVGCL